MSVTKTDRDINSLTKTAQTAVKLFFQECHKAGIKIFITETYRSQARQDYLYEQGRTRSGKIVTWTKSSRHTSRLAWDIAASTLNGNKDIYNTAIIKKAGKIALKLNITWGGTWKNNIDYPHFEVQSNWVIPKGFSLDEEVLIPMSSNKPIEFIGKTITPPISDTNKGDVILKFTNNTTKDVVRNHIKQMIDNGYIGKQWLMDFDNKKMTNGDYNALKLISDQKKGYK